MHYICTKHPYALLMCQWKKVQIHCHWDKQTLYSTMDVVQHCPNHQNKCCSILVNGILHPTKKLFGHTTLDCFNKFVHNPWYDGDSKVT